MGVKVPAERDVFDVERMKSQGSSFPPVIRRKAGREIAVENRDRRESQVQSGEMPDEWGGDGVKREEI